MKHISMFARRAAALLLARVCRVCRPAAGVIDWDTLEGCGARAKAAFSRLAEALQNGEGAVEAFSDSYHVLTDAAD